MKDYDIGFDCGFNKGYDLGYENGLKQAGSQETEVDSSSQLPYLKQYMLRDSVIKTNKEVYEKHLKNFVKLITTPQVNFTTVNNCIMDALQNNNKFLLWTCHHEMAINLNNSSSIKENQLLDIIKNSNFVLLPSTDDYDLVFYINQLIIEHNCTCCTASLNILAELFVSFALKDIYEKYKSIAIYDDKASHIINYLSEHRIQCKEYSSFPDAKIVLLGYTDYKSLKSLLKQKKIIIDITYARNKLINKTLPICIDGTP